MTFTLRGVFLDYNITYVYLHTTSSIQMLDCILKWLQTRILEVSENGFCLTSIAQHVYHHSNQQ